MYKLTWIQKHEGELTAETKTFKKPSLPVADKHSDIPLLLSLATLKKMSWFDYINQNKVKSSR
jgi:hypothetical protein